MLNIIFIIVGLAVIVFSANWLVNGASALAKKYNVSDMVIGLTIVAFGTSAPELTINIISTINGNTEIAIGNVLGSNIANILLILGISAIIFPLSIQKNTKWKEIPFSLLAALALLICANDIFVDHASANQLSRVDGLILLMFFIIFMVYTFGIARVKNGTPEITTPVREMKMVKAIALIVLGLTGLFFGGKYFVEGAVNIATMLGVSESVIGLTIVAVGTSLPELATSVVAAFKKKADIAVGNVIGSNIFNIFFILGVSATIKPLPFISSSNIDIYMVVIASLLLFLSTMTFKKARLDRVEGAIFILVYIAYISYLIIQS
jgi:cation:H+ antiporter